MTNLIKYIKGKLRKARYDKYYNMQLPNLKYPNEQYIKSEENINKADYYRLKFVYEDNKELTGRMLDVGCNDGYFLREFDWKFESLLGVDMFSVEDYTGKKGIQDNSDFTKNGKITFRTGVFEEIKFEEKEFNFIFAGEIIEHVVNVDKFLKKIRNIICRGGVFCLTTPDSIGKTLPEHYREFDAETLYNQLKKYFANVTIKKLPAVNNSWPFLYAKCWN